MIFAIFNSMSINPEKLIKQKNAKIARKRAKKSTLTHNTEHNQDKPVQSTEKIKLQIIQTKNSGKECKKLRRISKAELEQRQKNADGLPIGKNGKLDKRYKKSEDKIKYKRAPTRLPGTPIRKNADGSPDKRFKPDNERHIPPSIITKQKIENAMPALIAKHKARQKHLEKIQEINQSPISVYDLPEFPWFIHPYSFSPENVKDAIKEYKSTTKSIQKVLEEYGIKGESFYDLLDSYDQLRIDYEHAQEKKAEMLINETIEIADDGSNDLIEKEDKTGKTYYTPNHELVKRSDIRIKTRQWIAGKWNNRYKDKTSQEVTVKSLNINRNIDGNTPESNEALMDVITMFSGKK